MASWNVHGEVCGVAISLRQVDVADHKMNSWTRIVPYYAPVLLRMNTKLCVLVFRNYLFLLKHGVDVS